LSFLIRARSFWFQSLQVVLLRRSKLNQRISLCKFQFHRTPCNILETVEAVVINKAWPPLRTAWNVAGY
jgi:hypothetical protein